MNPKMSAPMETPGRFRLGDKVLSKYGWAGVVGEVIEDCGHIGRRGRRMYTVRWQIEDQPELPTPEEELVPASG